MPVRLSLTQSNTRTERKTISAIPKSQLQHHIPTQFRKSSEAQYGSLNKTKLREIKSSGAVRISKRSQTMHHVAFYSSVSTSYLQSNLR